MTADPKAPCLIVLDVQDAIDQPVWDGKNNPDYLTAIQKLLSFWRTKSWPVVHVRHDEPTATSSYYAKGPWNAFKTEVAPIDGEIIVPKTRNCGFIKTDLDKTLKSMAVAQIVMTGVVIHNSMDATIRAGKALGYDILLPMDATTAVPVKGPDGRIWDAQTVYDLSLAILAGEYLQLLSSDQVIQEMSLLIAD